MMKTTAQRGSALVIIIVAIGIVGGVTAYLMGQNETSMSRAKSLNMVKDAGELSAQMLRVLGDSTACKNSFGGRDAADSAITEIKNNLGQTVFDFDTQFGRTSLRFETLELKDEAGDGDGVKTLANGPGTTNLIMTYKLVNNSAYENRYLQRKIKIFVNQVGSKIDSCHAMSAGLDPLWKLVASAFDIYYAGGNIGVGTDDALEKLDVRGMARVQNESGERFSLGTHIELDEDRPLEVTYTTEVAGVKVTRLSDMRVSKAYGKERIKLSGAASPCNALTDKSIRFHTASATFQACVGSRWKTVKASDYPMYNTVGKNACLGFFGDCSAPCSGTETFTIIRQATKGGAACAYPNGFTQPCSVTCGPKDCVQDGKVVPHNELEDFFSLEIAPVGKTCTDFQIERRCKNKVLDGSPSYEFAECNNPCPTLTEEWDTCGATVSESVHDTTLSLPNTKTSSPGSAKFTCINGEWDVTDKVCTP